MALNLLTYVKSQFTASVVDQLGERLSETPAHTSAAVAAIIPTVLGALAKRTQSVSDAEGIVDVLRSGTYSKEATPFDIGQVTDTAAETQTAVSSGDAFVKQLFPNQLDQVAEQIARFSGVNRMSAHTLIDLVGSVLKGMLGRQTLDNGLTGLNLHTIVAGQVDEIRAGLPAGLASLSTLLGFDKLPGSASDKEAQSVTTFMSTPTNPDLPKSPLVEREHENIRWTRWAMFAVGALVLFLIIQKCRQPESSTEGVFTDTTARSEPASQQDTATTRQNIEKSNGSTEDTARGPFKTTVGTGSGMVGDTTAGVTKSVELPGGRRLNVVENSFNANLAGFMAGKSRPIPRTFTFENLTFDTNSARITKESQPNVNDLIEIMKAYPTLQINVQGHTDNTGDAAANKKLSLDRANAVREALTAAGIAANRVTTQGYGAEKPTATNDTAEGRQKNRRIDVVVAKL
ncbi:OmpA family protein [Fibrella sp. HMF5335]|uniref:OmpA family protein n=1 Tax=Fibrella rubiginis TaxID=2817060 RepID=A0A939K531_9BACT|nr:OmpA family protein [Fibrella rubiginis]MBO0936025.1 OmpA family protein [Fibrella rubiginis]